MWVLNLHPERKIKGHIHDQKDFLKTHSLCWKPFSGPKVCFNELEETCFSHWSWLCCQFVLFWRNLIKIRPNCSLAENHISPRGRYPGFARFQEKINKSQKLFELWHFYPRKIFLENIFLLKSLGQILISPFRGIENSAIQSWVISCNFGTSKIDFEFLIKYFKQLFKHSIGYLQPTLREPVNVFSY